MNEAFGGLALRLCAGSYLVLFRLPIAKTEEKV